LNIGVSYYNSTEFLLKDFDYKPIGNFGIGFLSCFMLSDDVKVLTRHYKSKNKYLIELEKGNEWTSLTESEDLLFDGTEVWLNHENFIKVFENDIKKVSMFLNQFFLTDGVDFELINKDDEEIDQIKNLIYLQNPLEKNVIKIDLNSYLNDIEGYVLIKNKSPFIKNLQEIDFEGDLYQYTDEDGFLQVKDPSLLRIDDYIKENKIKYLSIPIVEPHVEDDFIIGLKYTDDDVEEVISKLSRELTWISVIVPKEYQDYLTDSVIRRKDTIFEKFGFFDLEEIGHCETCATKAYVKTFTLFEGIKDHLYLPFEINTKNEFYWWIKSDKRKELFMRNVLIKDFIFSFKISASIFEINTIVANINSRKYIPDISRNNVDENARKSINFMIGKAIHQGARDNLALEAEEKKTLQTFIDTFYNDRSDLEK
jgi:hypothetical protein